MVILSSMCIVPRLLLTPHIVIITCSSELFVLVTHLSLKESWHLCFALNIKDYLIATYAIADYM